MRTLTILALMPLVGCSSNMESVRRLSVPAPQPLEAARPREDVSREERDRAISVVEAHYLRTVGYVPKVTYEVTRESRGPLGEYRVKARFGMHATPSAWVFHVTQDGQIIKMGPSAL